MKRIATWMATLGALMLAPALALAADAALLLIGDDYRRLPAAGGSEEAQELRQMLTASGFETILSLDDDARDAAEAMARFRAEAVGAERVFVFVSGHVVSTPREAWLLGRYGDAPTDLTIGAQAVPLGPLLDIAARHRGKAVVMVAPSDNAPQGEGLVAGMTLPAPDGVVVATGSLRDVAEAARSVVLMPGRPLDLLRDRVSVSGLERGARPFLAGQGSGARDEAFWQVAKTIGDVDAYEAYLEVYPNGRYAALARAAIRELTASAEDRAVATEKALGLNREARRDIQRDLSLLGYDPRGIDGIFGAGSRAAITAWQSDNGYEPTGYLSAEQVRAMSRAGEARALELEREAALRKAEEERRDGQYWRETGSGRDEAGLRAYLKRYPDGLFSDIAELRLKEIEDAKRAAAAAQERALWDQVRAEDKASGYRDYLRRYPNGTFADEANARLEALSEEDSHAAAKAEEQRVAGNSVARLLVENRLKAAGYEPGPVDGTFTKKTRRAIRKFQRASGLDVSGYVTQATMVRLLALR